MTCEEAGILLHALVDNELDAGHTGQVEAHAASCPHCTAQLRDYREMHAAMSAPEVSYRAPERLRGRIEAALPSATVTTLRIGASGRRNLLKGFGMGSVMSSALAYPAAIAIGSERRGLRVYALLKGLHLIPLLE